MLSGRNVIAEISKYNTDNTLIIVTIYAVHNIVFRYLYWSGSTAIYRAPLNSVRLNSTLESCASDVSSKVPLINNTQLEIFTIEPNDTIYYIGFDPCFETSSVAARRTNRSILGTPLNAGAVRIYIGIAGSGPVVSTDSFDRTLFSATDDLILVVDTSMVATCPMFPDIGVLQVRAPLLSLRTFRSVKQPLPGKQIYSVIGNLPKVHGLIFYKYKDN